MNTTAERINQIMEEENLRQADILERAKPICKKYGGKLTRQDLSQYVSGKVEPRQDKLFILAAALDVSEPWLMGYDVPRERTNSAYIPPFERSRKKRLARYFELLTEAQIHLVEQIAELGDESCENIQRMIDFEKYREEKDANNAKYRANEN